MNVYRANIMKWADDFPTHPPVDGDLIWAIAKTESSMDPLAFNQRTGAMGLFQLTPICLVDVVKRWKIYASPFHPQESTWVAKRYYAWLLKATGNHSDALRAWNWGIMNVQEWIQDGRKEYELPEETRSFVERVLKYWNKEE